MNEKQNKIYEVAIVGTGFSGLGMAIRLLQKGQNNFLLFERSNEVGGTWRENTYPGCGCDVESHLYSFSFAPNPNWSRMYSPQSEILNYLKNCAKTYNLYPHIHFGHSVQRAEWDEQNSLWAIHTSKGKFSAKILIAAAGPLSEPVTPNIEGLEKFQGKIMHSAQWDHNYDISNKRVAVIGTGASAIQLIPELQKTVSQLNIFQRTPPWVLPRMDRTFSEIEKKIFRKSPTIHRLLRARIYATREIFGKAFRNESALKTLEALAKLHLKRSIKDKKLRQLITPNYRIGCKRILISDNYYPALTNKNVKLHILPIVRITPNAIVTKKNATEKTTDVDAIIFSTGFATSEVPFAKHVFGKNNISLAEHWKGSPKAFLGIATTGFPNFFMLLGPNSGLGHNSVVLMIEAQIEHILATIQQAASSNKKTVEIKAEVEEKFVRFVDNKMKNSVWLAGGCHSWYIDNTGRNSTLWPLSVGNFVKKAKETEISNWV